MHGVHGIGMHRNTDRQYEKQKQQLGVQEEQQQEEEEEEEKVPCWMVVMSWSSGGCGALRRRG